MRVWFWMALPGPDGLVPWGFCAGHFWPGCLRVDRNCPITPLKPSPPTADNGWKKLEGGAMVRISESAAWCRRNAGKLLAGAALVISPVAIWTAPAGAQVPTCLGLPATIIGSAGHDVL